MKGKLIFFLSNIFLLLPFFSYGVYPEKPISIIVPFPRPETDDISVGVTGYTVSAFSEAVSKDLGVPVNIIYVVGEQGARAYREIAKADPDGYTLGAVGTSILGVKERGISQIGMESLTPIVQLTEEPIVFYVSSRLKIDNFKDFIEFIKKNPGKLRGAWGTFGGIQHVTFLGVFSELKLDPKKAVEWVYTKDVVRAMQDMKEGSIDFVVASLSEGYGMYKIGVAKPLAMAAPNRMTMLDVPTIKESVGVNFFILHWSGIVGPKNLPEPVIKKLESAFLKACHNEEVIKTLSKRALKPNCLGSDQFKEKVNTLEKEVIKVLKENNQCCFEGHHWIGLKN